MVLTLTLFATACVHQSRFVPFLATNPADAPVPPTNPANVGIYRSERPFAKFTELGLITYTTSDLTLPEVYEQLRQDCAKHGADAVIDLKIKHETHEETSTDRKCTPVTVCDPNGQCTTNEECHDETVIREVSTYLVEGSMIRRSL